MPRFQRPEGIVPDQPTFTSRVQISTLRLLALYIRQSSLKQKKEHKHSRELQTVDFVERAFTMGFTDETIVKFDDTGQSAVTDLEERTYLMELIALIKTGKVGTVLIYMVDRLFRSQYLEDAVLFAKACAENRVVLVTYYGQTFDFTDARDYEDFILECHKAYRQYKTQIIQRMGDMRKRSTLQGEYNGRYLARGLMRDPEKMTNIKPYAPHATIVLSLAELYRDLGFNTYKLSQQVAGSRVFPPIPAVLKPFFKYSGHPDSDGWWGLTYSGLISLFSTPGLWGWWDTESYDENGAKIFIKGHHDAILPLDLGLMCFDAASPTELDGTQKKRVVRYSQKDTVQVSLLKEHLIEAEDATHYIFLDRENSGGSEWRYRITTPGNVGTRQQIGQITMNDVEDAVVNKLFDILKQKDRFMDYATRMKHLAAQDLKERARLQGKLTALEEAIKIGMKNVASVTLDKEDLALWEQTRAGQKRERARLIAELEKAPAQEKAAKIMSVHDLLTRTQQEWNAGVFTYEDKKLLLECLMRRVTLKKLSSHFFRVGCEWEFVQEPSTLILWYPRGDSEQWTTADEELIRTHFPDRALLCDRLPTRSWYAIAQRAYRLGKGTQYHPRQVDWDAYLNVGDKEVLARYNLDLASLRLKETVVLDQSIVTVTFRLTDAFTTRLSRLFATFIDRSLPIT